jgi:hypothetical protein
MSGGVVGAVVVVLEFLAVLDVGVNAMVDHGSAKSLAAL